MVLAQIQVAGEGCAGAGRIKGSRLASFDIACGRGREQPSWQGQQARWERWSTAGDPGLGIQAGAVGMLQQVEARGMEVQLGGQFARIALHVLQLVGRGLQDLAQGDPGAGLLAEQVLHQGRHLGGEGITAGGLEETGIGDQFKG